MDLVKCSNIIVNIIMLIKKSFFFVFVYSYVIINIKKNSKYC